MEPQLRILLITPFPPFPPSDGGRRRIFEIAQRLAKRHEVDLLTLSAGEDDAQLVSALAASGINAEVVNHSPSFATVVARALLGSRSYHGSKFYSKKASGRVKERLATEHHDVIQLEFPYTAQMLPRDRRHAATFLTEHNVEFRLAARMRAAAGSTAYKLYARREQRLGRREELDACRLVDAVVAVSEEDARLLRSTLPGVLVKVVPNGVDPQFFSPSNDTHPDEISLVFTGKMDYRPNVDAVVWFTDEVLPAVRRRHPEVVFKIVGKNPTAEVERLARRPGVVVVGGVPDVRPYVRSASVFVAPLRAGSGTRLKILEALAMSRAVVSTQIGVEGLDVCSGVHLLIADAPEEFASRVCELLEDPGLRQRLGESGKRRVDDEYSWDRIVAGLEDLYYEELKEIA